MEMRVVNREIICRQFSIVCVAVRKWISEHAVPYEVCRAHNRVLIAIQAMPFSWLYVR